MKWGI